MVTGSDFLEIFLENRSLSPVLKMGRYVGSPHRPIYRTTLTSELHMQPGEVRGAVQAELHAVVLEAVVGFVGVLRCRLGAEDVVGAGRELDVLGHAVAHRQVGGRLRLVVQVRDAGGGTAERAQRLR